MSSLMLSNTLLRNGRRLATPTVRAAAARWHSTSPEASQSEESQPPTLTAPQQPTLMERTEKNYFQRTYEKHSISLQTNRILVAESFLQAASRQAEDPRWFGPGRIGSEFRSYQALLTMHLWFLHKRLISDNEDPHRAALIQEELFDIFWTDTSNRMRAHGVKEMSINKDLKTVQQYTFMHLFHYDHCYTELLDNPQERLAELKQLVQVHVLLLNPEDDKALEEHEDHAERIAWYIETQYQNVVHDWPDELYRKARVAWVDLPDFSKIKDARGRELEDVPVDPANMLPANWVRNVANDGSYYYWNTETRKSQWERPN